MTRPPIRVSVHCEHRYPDGTRCYSFRWDHVHQPLPCRNGWPDRHHDFAPPRTVRIDLGTRIATVRT